MTDARLALDEPAEVNADTAEVMFRESYIVEARDNESYA
jgi:hypothetical protein